MKSNADKQVRQGHPLAEVPGLAPAALAALKRQWLESAEQVLAASATPEGRAGLRALLGFDAAELEALLARLSAVVGPEAAARLRQATPGGAQGLIVSEEQRRRHEPE